MKISTAAFVAAALAVLQVAHGQTAAAKTTPAAAGGTPAAGVTPGTTAIRTTTKPKPETRTGFDGNILTQGVNGPFDTADLKSVNFDTRSIAVGPKPTYIAITVAPPTKPLPRDGDFTPRRRPSKPEPHKVPAHVEEKLKEKMNCLKGCVDKVFPNITACNPGEGYGVKPANVVICVNSLRREFGRCSVECVDKGVADLPAPTEGSPTDAAPADGAPAPDVPAPDAPAADAPAADAPAADAPADDSATEDDSTAEDEQAEGDEDQVDENDTPVDEDEVEEADEAEEEADEADQ